MKRIEELGISPAPWDYGRNPAFSDVLDGCTGKMIYANGDVKTTPPVGWAKVNYGNVEASIRNARLIAAAPDLYECLREAVVESCFAYCGKKDGECLVNKWRAALAKASGEEVAK